MQIMITTPSTTEVLVRWTEHLGGMLDEFVGALCDVDGVDAADTKRYSTRITVAEHVATATEVASRIVAILQEDHWFGEELHTWYPDVEVMCT